MALQVFHFNPKAFDHFELAKTAPPKLLYAGEHGDTFLETRNIFGTPGRLQVVKRATSVAAEIVYVTQESRLVFDDLAAFRIPEHRSAEPQ